MYLHFQNLQIMSFFPPLRYNWHRFMSCCSNWHDWKGSKLFTPSNQCVVTSRTPSKKIIVEIMSWLYRHSGPDEHTAEKPGNTCICCTWLPLFASQASLWNSWTELSETSPHELLYGSMFFSSKLCFYCFLWAFLICRLN